MSQPIELSCLGMKCPRPIIELAKLSRRVGPGSTIRVVADDLAFESDVKAWCETTKAELLTLEKAGTGLVATLRLPG
ncbi:MAG: sulfurtransferase TusA family protein [Deltaproteobacteria bacterium]|nr:sulfurtransferase TusA family protein [Deltaproteobacteria bacterium]